MTALLWPLLFLLGAGACVGWRLHRHPGGWAYAFGQAYALERRDLAGARRRLRTLEREARRERSRARDLLRGEESRHRGLVRAAQQRLTDLRRPGRGELLASLGEVALHRHVLRVAAQDLALAGVTVRYEQTPDEYRIHVTAPGGRKRPVRYPRADHEEADVRRLAGRIEDAAEEESAFRKRRRSLIADAEAELRRVRADTAAAEAARTGLAELTERQRADGRLASARTDLDAARARWQALTGHLSP